MNDSDVQITLGEVVETLKSYDPDKVIYGYSFDSACSSRAYYDQVCLTPFFGQTTVKELLAVAEGAVGSVYSGYKGGKYEMSKNSLVWYADYGSIGVELSKAMLVDMLEKDLNDHH